MRSKRDVLNSLLTIDAILYMLETHQVFRTVFGLIQFSLNNLWAIDTLFIGNG